MKNLTERLFNRPKIIFEAESTGGHKLWKEILFFVAVYAVAQVIAGVFSVPVTLIYYLRTGIIQNIVDSVSSTEAGTFEAVFDSLDNITEMFPESYYAVSLFLTIPVTAVCILYCRLIEKRPIRTMGFVKKGAVPEYLVGLAVGFAMFAASIGLCVLFGGGKITGLTANLKPFAIILFFVGFLFQGLSEEVLCRGYFMISMSRKNSVVAAVFINSAVFAALHLLNPGVTPLSIVNILLFGVFLSVYILRRGDLWGAAAIHSMWNFTQGNIFGVKVSGMPELSSVFGFETSKSRLINGGDFGLEGGLAVTLVLVLATVIVFLIKPKKDINSDVDFDRRNP